MSDETPPPARLPGFLGALWRLLAAGAIVLVLGAAGGYLVIERMIQTPEEQAPDVIALDTTDALRKASAAGFDVRLEGEEPSAILKAGQVLAQAPAPGEWAKAGSCIRLTLVSGGGNVVAKR